MMLWVVPGVAENTTPALLLLLPGAVSAQHWSCPLDDLVCMCGHGTMGSTPVKRDELAAAHCHSKKAHTQLQLVFVAHTVLCPGGTLDGRRSSDPRCQPAAVFPASSLQHRPAGPQCIAPSQSADGFRTPAFQVFMDSLPVK